MAATHEDRNAQLSPGVAIKAPCRAATVGAITLSGEQTVDGVALVSGDRCLVKNQASSIDNGIYEVDTGTWDRAQDFDGNRDVIEGTILSVNHGTTNADTMWRITSTGTIVFGTTALTFERAVVNDSNSVSFLQSGTGAGVRTLQSKERDIVNAADFTDGVGHFFSPSSTAAQNSLALANALASGAGIVLMNPGAHSYDNLNVSIPVTLKGSGTCTTNGAPSGNGTYLNYTGSGTGMIIGDSSGTDKEGFHISDFVITGSASANDGIQFGVSAGHWFLKSSCKRVFVRGFSKAGKAGFLLAFVLSSVFEQCYSQNNTLGWSAVGTTTNSVFTNCYARTNTSVGWTLQDITTSTFISCLSEANGDTGLELKSSGCGSLLFLNWYSTDNNSSAGSSPVNIGMSGTGNVTGIDFKGGFFQNANCGNVQFKMDKATAVFFDNPTISSANNGWMNVTANTSNCEFRSRSYPSLTLSDISGWTPQRIRVDVEDISWTPVATGTTGTIGAYSASTAQGWYTIKGDMCSFAARLSLSNKGSWTGTLQLSLPPFTVRSTGPVTIGSVVVGVATLNGQGCGLYMNPSSQIAFVEENSLAGGASSELTYANINNTTTFYYSGQFKI